MFCWPAIAGNKRATPLGFMYDKLDRILERLGEPCGLKTYIPFNSQGDDHIEDFIGMIGVPMEPVCEFPENDEGKSSDAGTARKVLLTAASLEDLEIVGKLRRFVEAGGHAIVTSAFMIGALEKYPEIKELTSVSYTKRTLAADEFQTPGELPHFKNYVKSNSPIDFPLLEHRNNATWSIMNAGHGEYHESILCYDTYGRGRFTVLCTPQMPSKLYDLPVPVLGAIRKELDPSGIWLEGESGVSLFTYDNKTFGLYAYAWDGCKQQNIQLHIKGSIKELIRIPDSERPQMFKPAVIKPLYEKNGETVFSGRVIPGEFDFFVIKE